MSQENVKLFYEALVKDEGLKAKFVAIGERHKGEAPAEAALEGMFQTEVLPLAKSAGFEFTFEEVKAYAEQARQSQTDDLSDEELAAVAGGYGANQWCGNNFYNSCNQTGGAPRPIPCWLGAR